MHPTKTQPTKLNWTLKTIHTFKVVAERLVIIVVPVELNSSFKPD